MIDVDLQARVSDGTRRFDLAVRFASDAPVVALYGPSGAGKSLTLQAMAGLQRLTGGHVRIGGRTLFDAERGVDVSVAERRVGYLFQHYALFPHLSVRDNVAFGLTRWWRRRPSHAQAQRIDALLDSFGLASFAASRPASLSGGQQQRVALARALVCAPSVLLLDEPFAALNPMLRQTLRSELAQVCAQWRTPVVMITHDVDDVLALADVVFVIEQGQAVREVDVRRGDGRELTQRALVHGWVTPTVTAAERSVRRWLERPRVADATLLSGDLKLAGRLDARFFALLEAIDGTGSINRAARTAGYSYKGAWMLLETAANLASEPLLESATGGKGGGGTRLTAAAHDLLAGWRTLQSRHRAFLQEQEAWLIQQPALAGLLRRISMKTTARNQFAGSVSAVDAGPVTTQVMVTLAGGQEIVATMTSTAAHRLGLAVGKEAIALVKSSAVVLVVDFAGYALSARNQFAGTIARVGGGTRLTAAAHDLLAGWRTLQSRHRAFLQEQEAWLIQQPALAGLLRRISMKTTARNQFAGSVSAVDAGPVTTQVMVTLAGGQEIVATMTSTAAHRLGLAVGKEAIALVKSSAVVLVVDFAGYALSARNQFAGTISRVERGAVSSLVVVTLPGGAHVTASVTNDAVEAIGLGVGQAATAVFKAYSVMLAVAT